MNRSLDRRVTRMNDPFGPPSERGMFVKEAYLGADARRAVAASPSVKDRAIDTAFVAALEGELSMAYRLAGYLLADSAEAQDAVQESSVRAWKGWAGLRERAGGT